DGGTPSSVQSNPLPSCTARQTAAVVVEQHDAGGIRVGDGPYVVDQGLRPIAGAQHLVDGERPGKGFPGFPVPALCGRLQDIRRRRRARGCGFTRGGKGSGRLASRRDVVRDASSASSYRCDGSRTERCVLDHVHRTTPLAPGRTTVTVVVTSQTSCPTGIPELRRRMAGCATTRLR